jgi:hypothetical protein
MYEDRVAHFGNGVRLLEYVIGSEDWKAKYDTSKYNPFPLYGDIHAGKLFLQDHGNPVWYRNIKIRPLASDPWTNQDFLWPDQATGITLGPPGRGFQPALRVTRDGQGRLMLHLSRSETWRLGVSDSRGNRLEGYGATGSGSGSIGISGLQSGAYFLTGTVGDRPYSLPFSLIGP